MSNGDDRLIGEIHAMTKSQGDDIRRLFLLVSDMREGNCPQGRAIGERVGALEGCVRKWWLMILVAIGGGAGGGAGIQKALSILFGG